MRKNALQHISKKHRDKPTTNVEIPSNKYIASSAGLRKTISLAFNKIQY